MKLNFRLIGKAGLLLVVFGFFQPMACQMNGFQLAKYLDTFGNPLLAIILYFVLFSAIAGCIIGILLLIGKNVKLSYDWVCLSVCIGCGLIVYLTTLSNNGIKLQSGVYFIIIGWIIALFSQIKCNKKINLVNNNEDKQDQNKKNNSNNASITSIIIPFLGLLILSYFLIPDFQNFVGSFIKRGKNEVEQVTENDNRQKEYVIWDTQKSKKYNGGTLTIKNWPYKNNMKLSIWIREHNPNKNRTQSEESSRATREKLRNAIANGETVEFNIQSYLTVAHFADMFGVSPFYLVDSEGNDWYGNGNFDVIIRGSNGVENIALEKNNVIFSNGSASIDYYNMEIK